MTTRAPSRNASSYLLPIATALAAVAIFAGDSLTPLDIPVAALYVVVVLMAARFLQPRAVMLVAAGCACLTLVEAYLSPPPASGSIWVGAANTLISLTGIGLTTFLVVRAQWADAVSRDQAKLLDLTHDSIFSRGMDHAITFWNRGSKELFGWTRDEALGKVSHQLLQTSFPLPLDQIMTEFLRTGRWEGELVYRRRDGSRVVSASRWSLQQDPRGQPIGILATNNDITERKNAQEALQQAQANLERLNRVMLLGEMTASIAHEVRQPIAAAKLNAGVGLRWLSADPPEIEEARQALTRIVRDAERANEVIDRVRALVKKAPPRKSAVNINDAIVEVMALTESELQRNRVKLQRRLSSALPLVTADRIQLQQVILNLIVNAIEAMSGTADGPRELTVVTGGSEPGDVFVEVRDSGPGLDPASLDHVFDTLYTTKPNGTGMGLAICRAIVEVHGGRISAAANEPQGASFRFTLPLADESSPGPAPSHC
jgi:two-component system, LuxR family, sensor kinase FixL